MSRRPDATNAGREYAGFTLLEVMAGVLLTSIVISIAVAFQVNLGSSMKNARERLRSERQAVALLDRMARDISGAYYIVPNRKVARTLHPWIFLAVQDFAEEDGKADALKFITRNFQPQGLEAHASDLAVVAYFLNPMEDVPGYELLRWRSTSMPQTFDSSFPATDDPDVDVMGEGIAVFGVSMIDPSGAEYPTWNSAMIGGATALPIGVKLEIGMVDPNLIERARADPDFNPELGESETEDEPKTFSKLVLLPLRPLDWKFIESETRPAVTATATDAEDSDGDGIPDDEDEDPDDPDVPIPGGGASGGGTGFDSDTDRDAEGEEEEEYDFRS